MSKIVTLEEYKGTFLEKCYTRDSNIEPEKILNQLNSNLEKGLITEELHGKAVIQLNSLIEKGGKKEMIGKITVGKNGKKYKKVAEGKWMEVSEHGMTKEEHGDESKNKRVIAWNTKDDEYRKRFYDQSKLNEEQASKLSDKEYSDEEVGVKGGDFSENKVKEAVYQGPKEKYNGKIMKIVREEDGTNTVIVDEKEGRKILNVPDSDLRFVESKTSKHISDMSKEEKHSMAEKMGISGHKEMTEKELSKQLIERKIDNELKGGERDLKTGDVIVDEGGEEWEVRTLNREGVTLRSKDDSDREKTVTHDKIKGNELKEAIESKFKEGQDVYVKHPDTGRYHKGVFNIENHPDDKPGYSRVKIKGSGLITVKNSDIVDSDKISFDQAGKMNIKKSFEENISILKGEQLEGGLGDNLSVEDIAKKHKVSKETIENQLEIGIEVEMEHTNDKLKAKEIVLDHLTEASDYYTKLSEMEKK